MKCYKIEPEVAGGTGRNTIMNTKVHPPDVSSLHYEFYGWLGDALLTSFPCYIVTKELAVAMESAHLTGFKFDQVQITKSGEFEDLYPNRQLPEFLWLRVFGRPGIDDFGLIKPARLIVSERALALLTSFGIANAIVEPFEETGNSGS